MKIALVFTVLLLLVVNMSSCEKLGIIDFVGDNGDVERVLVNLSDQPFTDIGKLTVEDCGKTGDSYITVSFLWAYVMVITFTVLVVLFPPYRWLFIGILIILTMGQINRLKS